MLHFNLMCIVMIMILLVEKGNRRGNSIMQLKNVAIANEHLKILNENDVSLHLKSFNDKTRTLYNINNYIIVL